MEGKGAGYSRPSISVPHTETVDKHSPSLETEWHLLLSDVSTRVYAHQGPFPKSQRLCQKAPLAGIRMKKRVRGWRE